jgi:hypothetical protein
MRKLCTVILAALAMGIVASPASAAQRLAWGGSSNEWVNFWQTQRFATASGLIDIWYTCRPKNSSARLRLVLHRSDGRERVFYPACDRRGHWIQNIVVSSHPHDVYAEIDNGLATGWTSVYRGR